MRRIFTLILLICSFIFYGQRNTVKGFYNEDNLIEYILQDYIQIPSVSGNEKEAADFLKTVCKNNGLYITPFGSDQGSHNFAASILPLSEGKPNIILMNHMDVVPENPTEDLPAYSGALRDEKIYGRGAIDNKGAAMMQLFGICQFLSGLDRNSLNYNVTFLAVACEETQCDLGASYLVENYIDDLNAVVVFGEGPGELSQLLDGEFEHPIFGISLNHKRALWLKLELEYQHGGHGSVSPEHYATKELIQALDRLTGKKSKTILTDMNTRFLKELGGYYSGMKKFSLRHPKLIKPFLVPKLREYPEMHAVFTNTITLTDIYSDSEAVNQISIKAGAYLDCRLLPETDERLFLNEMRRKLKNDSIQIEILKRMPKNEPSEIDNIFYETYVLALQDKYPDAEVLNLMMPNINDLGHFRSLGIPCYGTIPSYLSMEEVQSIHADKENIRLSSVYDGADVYLKFLKRILRDE